MQPIIGRTLNLVIVAALAMVTLSTLNPAEAKPTPLARSSAAPVHVGSHLPDDNMDRVDDLEGRVDDAEQEMQKLRRMRRQIIDACSDLPQDVVCDAELTAAKAELTGQITALQGEIRTLRGLITSVDQANRTWTTAQIQAAEARVDTKLASARRARQALRREVMGEINTINARWRPALSLSTGVGFIAPVRVYDVTGGMTAGLGTGLVLERKDVGIGLDVGWSALSNSNLQGQFLSVAAYGYARRDNGWAIGGGLAPHWITLHDSIEDLNRYQAVGFTPFGTVSHRWTLSEDSDTQIDVFGRFGPNVDQVYAYGEDKGVGFNGVSGSVGVKVVFGGRNPKR